MSSARRSAARMAGLVVFIAAVPSAGAASMVGFAGTGQTGFSDVPCPAHAAVVGLVTNADTSVEGLAPVCSLLPLPGQVSHPGGVSYSGGTSAEDDCPSGQAVVGVAGRAGAWLDQLQAVCQEIGPDGVASGPLTTLTARGGNGGGAVNASCASGEAAVAVRIVQDDVDQHVAGIYLVCQALIYPPVCSGDSTATGFGTQAVATLSCTGTAPAYSVSAGAPPRHGTVEISGNRLTYTPQQDWFGDDDFMVTAANSAGSADDLVHVTVGKPAPPACSGDHVSTGLGIAIGVSPSCAGSGLIFSIASAPAHGSAAIDGATARYTPTAGFSGPDAFDVTATDIAGQTAVDHVDVSVVPGTAVEAPRVVQPIAPRLVRAGRPRTRRSRGHLVILTGRAVVCPAGGEPCRAALRATARRSGRSVAAGKSIVQIPAGSRRELQFGPSRLAVRMLRAGRVAVRLRVVVKSGTSQTPFTAGFALPPR